LRGILAVSGRLVSAGLSEATGRKRSEPLAGCEAQQTHGSLAEEAVEVGRNHVDGTRLAVW